MTRKTTLALILSLLITPFSPSPGLSHHHHGDVALAWGLTGFFLGSALTAFTYRPPPPVVYTSAPVYQRPAVYRHAPHVPPGACRWERYVLDGYGRNVFDPYGRPLKEYTIGSCQYPPY